MRSTFLAIFVLLIILAGCNGGTPVKNCPRDCRNACQYLVEGTSDEDNKLRTTCFEGCMDKCIEECPECAICENKECPRCEECVCEDEYSLRV